MRRVFKTRHFAQWLKKTELSDNLLLKAVNEMEHGLIDANLGGNVFKKRIALPRRGKSRSVRTIIATNKNNRWFFIFGYEKTERANLSKPELKALQAIATNLLNYSDDELNIAVTDNRLKELP